MIAPIRFSVRPCRRAPRGFSLVVSLTLMILLTILALGLLTLSGVALRGSSQVLATTYARANARMALQLAIGQLQLQSGTDTRITARADILDPDNPPLLGVWRSWQGDNHEKSGAFAGRPVSPGNYKSAKQSRFIAWLTSANFNDPATLPDSRPGPAKATVVGTGTLGRDRNNQAMQVHLTPTAVRNHNQRGAIAWWIGGENQKARVPKPHHPPPATTATWAAQMKSHPVADPKPFNLEPLLDKPGDADKVITLPQADLVGEGSEHASRRFFHDLSAVSCGLLVNVANGGWRKDLSLLTESWNNQPSSNLPLFRLTPQRDATYSRPSAGDPIAAGSMFYPWAAYRGNPGNIPIYQHGPVTSWENLADFATLYKQVQGNQDRLSINTWSVAIDNGGNSYGFLHRVRILPVIARMQWVFSHSSAPAANDPSKYEPRLLVSPVITLWNPYNLEITTPALRFWIPKPLPAALRYSINGVANNNYNCLMGGASNNNPPLSSSNSLTYDLPGSYTLKPGETLLCSPARGTSPVPAGSALQLEPGYRSSLGHYFPVKDDSGNTLALPAATTLKCDAKFDTSYNDFASTGVASGVGIYLDMIVGGARHLVYRMVYTPEIANVVYRPLTQLASGTLSQCHDSPVPFLSTIFGARMASRTHLAAKGFVQSSPLVNYTAMGRKDEEESTIRRHYGGTAHPVNSPFDYSFVSHPAGGDSLLPNASDSSNRGYIVTGFVKAEGLSRCVIDELPARPVSSLGELVHWDLRYENPIPPYAFNLIGNSDASPLLPANAVVNANDRNLAENLQYDDSYCANHLLFDDWFVSSITPNPTAFGTAGRNQRTAFIDFLTNKQPLPNRCYQPLLADRAAAIADSNAATKFYNEHVNKTTSYRSIASRLEVEGMFNVNSTSVTAWRALLGHARRQAVPHVSTDANSWKMQLTKETDYAVPRFSVSGDREAGAASTSGAFPEANDFAGFCALDDRALDSLAEKIVAQIRLRGPFLSLAEFINRQLSSGDLALAGALQAALNQLAADPSVNPYAAIMGLSSQAVAAPPGAASTEYQFPAAAIGYSAYGLPGWPRQADFLRPLAPILAARDDTFIIRAYGDARNDKNQIIARCVCEAVVRRTRDFVDPAEAPDILNPPVRPLNKSFGRRYQLISFRWLPAGAV